jgi:hypothetical protein
LIGIHLEKGAPVRLLNTFTNLLRHRRIAPVAVVALLSVALVSQANAVPLLYNTGVDDSGNALAAGAADPHYKLIASDDAAFPAPPTASAFVTQPILPAGWLPNTTSGAASQWISPNQWQTEPDVQNPPSPIGNVAGTYIYELTFDLTGLDPKNVSISGAWAVGSVGLLYLNSQYVLGTTNINGAGSLSGFSIPAGSNFSAGVNHLDFVVITGGPVTGLRVEGISVGIPEPSTVVLAGLGVVGLVLARVRRNRKG